MAEHPRGAVLRRAIETCISPGDHTNAKLSELFTDNATTSLGSARNRPRAVARKS